MGIRQEKEKEDQQRGMQTVYIEVRILTSGHGEVSEKAVRYSDMK